MDFSGSLYHAAFNDHKKEEKDSPLFTSKGEPKLRIRALQHMTITHLQRRLAVLAKDIMTPETVTEA